MYVSPPKPAKETSPNKGKNREKFFARTGTEFVSTTAVMKVNFLRPEYDFQKKDTAYNWPDAEDHSHIDIGNNVKILPNLQMTRRGKMMFH